MHDEYFRRFRDWLELEAIAERQRLADRQALLKNANAERTGETLLDLAIEDHESGLGGRYLLTMVKRNRSVGLPWNRLRVGSPVVVSVEGDSRGDSQFGVVCKRTPQMIQVAVDDWVDGERFRLDLSPDEVTRKRQLAALKRVESVERGRLAKLRDILLCESTPTFADHVERETPGLNESQQRAIEYCLAANDVAIIHGPPGTGKTTTVVELICQAVARGESVLACAPSNTAVDNIVERLVDKNQSVVRLGHPARVAERLRAYTLDAFVEQHDVMKMVKEFMKEAEGLFRKAGRFTRSQPARGAKREMRDEARRLKRDARLLEKQAVEMVLDKCLIVCATITFDEDILTDRQFDLVVIDEACQSTEPGCWIPIPRGERVVLAGDHCQLPPTVLSAEAAKAGFSVSMLERLIQEHGTDVSRRLDVQYRMHREIMQFSSQQFYDDGLIADNSVAEHLLSDLPHVDSTPLTQTPVTFIDSAGAGWDEQQEEDGLSRFNASEATLVIRKAVELIESGVPARDIAVIAPYAAQVRLIREQCRFRDLEIDTVDGFQGREKEAVLISLVRSNSDGEIGFLSDTRRMNVALTRARRKLIVIGDSATLANSAFYADMFAWFESIGAYSSVWEEQQ